MLHILGTHREKSATPCNIDLPNKTKSIKGDIRSGLHFDVEQKTGWDEGGEGGVVVDVDEGREDLLTHLVGEGLAFVFVFLLRTY